MKWTEQDFAVLREHYATKGSGFVAKALGRTDKQVQAKASKLGIRVVSTTRCGKPMLIRAPGSPPIVIASKRGPAYLSGPLVFTDQTRRVVCPSVPQSLRTNTYTVY